MGTDQNIKYIDLTSGVVKTSHHATFDEAWYLQASRPPAAQLLYDMGLEFDDDAHDATPNALPVSDDVVLETIPQAEFNTTPYPPFPEAKDHALYKAPPSCLISPLPLRETAVPRHRTAAAARVSLNPTPTIPLNNAADIATEFMISPWDIANIYMSPDPYHEFFEEEVDIRRFDLQKHQTAGLCLAELDGRLFLGDIAKSTPCARSVQGSKCLAHKSWPTHSFHHHQRPRRFCQSIPWGLDTCDPFIFPSPYPTGYLTRRTPNCLQRTIHPGCT